MVNDGVALTSAEHPLHPEQIKAVAVAIAIADGVDPYQQSEGTGMATMPKGQKYELWEVRKAQAEAAIKATYAWADAQPQDINPGSIEEIEVRSGETLREALYRHEFEKVVKPAIYRHEVTKP